MWIWTSSFSNSNVNIMEPFIRLTHKSIKWIVTSLWIKRQITTEALNKTMNWEKVITAIIDFNPNIPDYYNPLQSSKERLKVFLCISIVAKLIFILSKIKCLKTNLYYLFSCFVKLPNPTVCMFECTDSLWSDDARRWCPSGRSTSHWASVTNQHLELKLCWRL